MRREKLKPEEEVRINEVMWTHVRKLPHRTATEPRPLLINDHSQNHGGTFRIFNIQVSR